MKLTITDRYLVLPINTNVGQKKLLFRRENGAIAFDFNAPLDAVHPKYYSYLHVERFLGERFDVVIEPEAEFSCTFAPRLPGADPENSRRPFAHYTVRRGWLGDPNGLFFYGGRYHMFYQYNPATPLWGYMHWGHAVSEDLVRWRELEPALYPDEMGNIFSGCAFVDSENASGLRRSPDAPDPILLYYTAAGGLSEQSAGKSFTQCLAYSLDGGESFEKYAGNPILETGGGENRDPKVTWAPELSCYVMALYLEEDVYALYISADLLRWSEFQRLTLADESECPDFYPLTGEGKERLWVLSGGEDRYLVGRLTPDGFVPTQSARSHHHGSRCSYAGQTYAFPDAVRESVQRRIRLTYDKMHMPDSPFENQIGIPTEMSLVKSGDIYRLASWPVREIESLYAKTTVREGTLLGAGETVKVPLERCACDLFVESDGASGEYDMTVFGVTLYVRPSENRIIVSSPHSDDYDMPISYGGGRVSLRLIIDVAGVEIFADQGLVYSTAEVTADFGMSYVALYSADGARIESFTAHALKSVRDGEGAGGLSGGGIDERRSGSKKS